MWRWPATVLFLLATAAVWLYPLLAPVPLLPAPPAPVPKPEFVSGRLLLRPPARCLVAQVAEYSDELFGYLMFDYLRATVPQPLIEPLLTYRPVRGEPRYPLLLHFRDEDLIAAIPLLARLHAAGVVHGYDWCYAALPVLAAARQQTATFVAAYNMPARRKLEAVPPRELARYTRGFLRFKSITDRRVREKIVPVPQVLSPARAARLAGDIVAVARFYDLPLEFFLGIGAMENNYMNVPGDLEHTAWKARPEPGDIVLARRGRRVLVRNDSRGVWQITRESLRYAHRLYLKDQRDYNTLRMGLRPPVALEIDRLDPETLTTYAGLFFRDLLDHFPADVASAVGAYNGGVRRPNERYQAGVARVAQHARGVLERAAALNAHAAVGTVFLAPGRAAVPSLR